jgi:hypothetical protein
MALARTATSSAHIVRAAPMAGACGGRVERGGTGEARLSLGVRRWPLAPPVTVHFLDRAATPLSGRPFFAPHPRPGPPPCAHEHGASRANTGAVLSLTFALSPKHKNVYSPCCRSRRCPDPARGRLPGGPVRVPQGWRVRPVDCGHRAEDGCCCGWCVIYLQCLKGWGALALPPRKRRAPGRTRHRARGRSAATPRPLQCAMPGRVEQP